MNRLYNWDSQAPVNQGSSVQPCKMLECQAAHLQYCDSGYDALNARYLSTAKLRIIVKLEKFSSFQSVHRNRNFAEDNFTEEITIIKGIFVDLKSDEVSKVLSCTANISQREY